MFLKLFLIHISLIIIVCSDSKFKYRIAVPEFICTNNATANDSPGANNDETKIRLLGLYDEDMKYEWAISFKTDGRPRGNQQRFNLQVWQCVRELEKMLQLNGEEIARKGVVSLNNSMMIPGVQYIFNLTTINENTALRETNQFVIDYVDPKTAKPTAINSESNENTHKPKISILLLSPDGIYPDMEYIVYAEITICSNFSDYKIRWDVSLAKNESLGLHFPSSTTLYIPSGTFIARKAYKISCAVLDFKTMEVLTQTDAYVNVLERLPKVQISARKLVISANTPFVINADFQNVNRNIKSLLFTWTCKDDSKTVCTNFESINTTSLNVSNGFSDPGRYSLQLEVAVNSIKISDQINITIIEEQMPLITIIPTTDWQNVDPSKPLTIKALISNVQPGCFLQWSAQHEPNCSYIDFKDLPGNIGENRPINSLQDNFLQELSDSMDESSSFYFNLDIPGPNLDSWTGFEGDTCYKFQLTIKCESLDDDSPSGTTEFEPADDSEHNSMSDTMNSDVMARSTREIDRDELTTLPDITDSTSSIVITSSEGENTDVSSRHITSEKLTTLPGGIVTTTSSESTSSDLSAKSDSSDVFSEEFTTLSGIATVTSSILTSPVIPEGMAGSSINNISEDLSTFSDFEITPPSESTSSLIKDRSSNGSPEILTGSTVDMISEFSTILESISSTYSTRSEEKTENGYSTEVETIKSSTESLPSSTDSQNSTPGDQTFTEISTSDLNEKLSTPNSSSENTNAEVTSEISSSSENTLLVESVLTTVQTLNDRMIPNADMKTTVIPDEATSSDDISTSSSENSNSTDTSTLENGFGSDFNSSKSSSDSFTNPGNTEIVTLGSETPITSAQTLNDEMLTAEIISTSSSVLWTSSSESSESTVISSVENTLRSDPSTSISSLDSNTSPEYMETFLDNTEQTMIGSQTLITTEILIPGSIYTSSSEHWPSSSENSDSATIKIETSTSSLENTFETSPISPSISNMGLGSTETVPVVTNEEETTLGVISSTNANFINFPDETGTTSIDENTIPDDSINIRRRRQIENNTSDEDGMIVIYAEILIYTNTPPKINELKVTPDSGEALNSVFKLNSEPATDKSTDLPLLYKFGYILGEEKLIIKRNYDISNIETILPYSENPIQFFLEVCDARGSCGKVNGNEIRTTLPENIEGPEQSALVKTIIQQLGQYNFPEAFSLAKSVLITFKAKSPELHQQTIAVIKQTVSNIITEFGQNNTTAKFSRSDINSFLTEITQILSELELPENSLQILVKLRDQSLGANSRRKRQTIPVKMESITPEIVQNFIEISSLLILRSANPGNEKKLFAEKIPKYLAELCKNIQTGFHLDTPIIKISFDKMNIQQSFNDILEIPYTSIENENVKFKLGKLFKDSVTSNFGENPDLCIGKIVYNTNYLSQNQSDLQTVYNVGFYDTKSNRNLQIEPLNDFGIHIKIPLNRTTDSYECVTWAGQKWDNNFCTTVDLTTNFLHCQCKKLGYFSISKTNDVLNISSKPNQNTISTFDSGKKDSITQNKSNISTDMTLKVTLSQLSTNPTIIRDQNLSNEFILENDTETQIAMPEGTIAPNFIGSITSEFTPTLSGENNISDTNTNLDSDKTRTGTSQNQTKTTVFNQHSTGQSISGSTNQISNSNDSSNLASVNQTQKKAEGINFNQSTTKESFSGSTDKTSDINEKPNFNSVGQNQTKVTNESTSGSINKLSDSDKTKSPNLDYVDQNRTKTTMFNQTANSETLSGSTTQMSDATDKNGNPNLDSFDKNPTMTDTTKQVISGQTNASKGQTNATVGTGKTDKNPNVDFSNENQTKPTIFNQFSTNETLSGSTNQISGASNNNSNPNLNSFDKNQTKTDTTKQSISGSTNASKGPVNATVGVDKPDGSVSTNSTNTDQNSLAANTMTTKATPSKTSALTVEKLDVRTTIPPRSNSNNSSTTMSNFDQNSLARNSSSLEANNFQRNSTEFLGVRNSTTPSTSNEYQKNVSSFGPNIFISGENGSNLEFSNNATNLSVGNETKLGNKNSDFRMASFGVLTTAEDVTILILLCGIIGMSFVTFILWKRIRNESSERMICPEETRIEPQPESVKYASIYAEDMLSGSREIFLNRSSTENFI